MKRCTPGELAKELDEDARDEGLTKERAGERRRASRSPVKRSLKRCAPESSLKSWTKGGGARAAELVEESADEARAAELTHEFVEEAPGRMD